MSTIRLISKSTETKGEKKMIINLDDIIMEKVTLRKNGKEVTIDTEEIYNFMSDYTILIKNELGEDFNALNFTKRFAEDNDIYEMFKEYSTGDVELIDLFSEKKLDVILSQIIKEGSEKNKLGFYNESDLAN